MGPGVLDFQNTVDDWETLRQPARVESGGGVAPSSAGQTGLQPDGYSALRYGLFSPPDGQSFDVSPRRRLLVKVTAAALPVGNTVVALSTVLTDTLAQDDGILLEYLSAQLSVVPGAGATVTIRDLALILGGSVQFFPLTTPTLTTLTPVGLDTLLFPAIPLLTARDLNAMLLLFSANAFNLFAGFQPLNLTLTIGFSDTVLASTVSATFAVMYRVVHGLTGA